MISVLSIPHAALADVIVSASSKQLPKTTKDTPFPELASAAEALRAWKVASMGDAAANDLFHDDWPHW
jgi:hypothetical protein